MRTQAWMMLSMSAVLTGLAGCGGDHSANNADQPPPTPATTDFDMYAQSLVSNYSCETNPPAETNGIDFSFSATQDTDLPASTDDITSACKV